jgi:hypothetical protein
VKSARAPSRECVSISIAASMRAAPAESSSAVHCHVLPFANCLLDDGYGLFEIDIHSHAHGVPQHGARPPQRWHSVVEKLQRTCGNAHAVV